MSSAPTSRCEFVFFFSSRRRHTRFDCDWSSDVCSSDLEMHRAQVVGEDFEHGSRADGPGVQDPLAENRQHRQDTLEGGARAAGEDRDIPGGGAVTAAGRSEEHTSELQSQSNLVCRLLLEKKKKIPT